MLIFVDNSVYTSNHLFPTEDWKGVFIVFGLGIEKTRIYERRIFEVRNRFLLYFRDVFHNSASLGSD